MTDKLESDAFGLLKQTLRQLMNEYADYVATGGCASYENYMHVTGKIAGLAQAERELLDIEERLYKE